MSRVGCVELGAVTQGRSAVLWEALALTEFPETGRLEGDSPSGFTLCKTCKRGPHRKLIRYQVASLYSWATREIYWADEL
jgi:hypothetical protein